MAAASCSATLDRRRDDSRAAVWTLQLKDSLQPPPRPPAQAPPLPDYAQVGDDRKVLAQGRQRASARAALRCVPPMESPRGTQDVEPFEHDDAECQRDGASPQLLWRPHED